MLRLIGDAGWRVRLLLTRGLGRLGFQESTFLLLVALAIGVITAAAAVAFHELILFLRDLLYAHSDPHFAHFLYGKGIFLLALWPALGGLAVGVTARYIVRAREGHGVIDVMESVVRSSGFVKPMSALEKIITSAITIGTGGSAGAEGPIVQIGAAIASGVGSAFRIARQKMPLLIGCGSAAGISAIFNSPIGGVLFALEVILQDFSSRVFAPVVIASVVANVTTQGVLRHLHEWWPSTFDSALSIFQLPPAETFIVTWPQLANFALLGIICGAVSAGFTELMHRSERWFAALPVNRAVRPAIGGGMLGILAIGYVITFGWAREGFGSKPISFESYPLPAFLGDGYGFIQELFSKGFYAHQPFGFLIALLAFLVLAKAIGTCLTISSGGSGGIIAPSLYLGAVSGGLLGLLLQRTGLFANVQPQTYALVGMGAVLGAVVHAPMSSILILLELTHDNGLILPAMLATVVATGVSRRIHPESIYTMTLRQRGIDVGNRADLLLRQLNVEQVDLEPAAVVQPGDPLERVLTLSGQMGVRDFAVIDKAGLYVGMLVASDINTALLEREAVPLLTVAELMRPDVPLVRSTEDLASVLERFEKSDVAYLPVEIVNAPGKVVGFISRAGVIRRYRAG